MKSAILLFALVPLLVHAQGTADDYARAAGLQQRLQNKVFRANVAPHWLEGGKLWYRVQTGANERETVLVDSKAGTREKAFNNAALADALAKKIGKSVDEATMNIVIGDFDQRTLSFSYQGSSFKLDRRSGALSDNKSSGGEAVDSLPAFLPPKASGSGEETQLTLENRWTQPTDLYWINTDGQRVKYFTLAAGEKRTIGSYATHVWLFTDANGKALAAYEATAGACAAVFTGQSPKLPPARRSPEISPDGKWRLITQSSNLWMHPVEGGANVQLSTDGKFGDDYNGPLLWSPDGKYASAVRTEDGERHIVSFVRSSPPDQLQPKLEQMDYLKPGDRIPHPRLMIFDVATKKQIPVATDLTPNPYDLDNFHWAADGKELYFTYNQRGHQVLRLLAANAATGAVRTITEETSSTFVDYSQKEWVRYLDKSGEALWASERSGWNHIYLINLKTGAIKPVTSGDWVVRSVDDVDEDKRELLLRVMGRNSGQDPYYMHFLRVSFDGKMLAQLTEGDGTHRLVWSPDKSLYLDIYSRVDLAPVTELRRSSDGKLVVTLERGDISALNETGWSAPERFVAKGRDGKTDIYGLIQRPTNFDPSKEYPVIESIYAGPHDFFVPKNFAAYRGTSRVGELGFIIVQIDGMGTNWRSKAFHDVCWKNLADAGFPDRILWMKEAAKTRPWMDLDRVGVYGTSAGGQSAASAVMRFGDFYKAAVADCGCHDNRMDKIWWNEAWMGWPVGPEYAANSNVTAAKDLKGKLFLMVGEVDTNVDPASTMQVANALIKAGKDFDFLVVPNSNHGVLGQPYPFRRMQDFFIRALYGREPRI